jgi:TMEM70/TMEM186/TMEM223 protein family
MVTLFRSTRQLLKVRGVMLFSLACAAGGLWWGVNLARTDELVLGVIVALLGVSFAIGMWVYGWCYVAKIELDQQTGELYVYTLRFPFGSKKEVFHKADTLSSSYHEGKFDGGAVAPSVDAPWRSLRLSGRRLPLIIDQQGEFLQEELMNELLDNAGLHRWL